jgi:aspartate oxidase
MLTDHADVVIVGAGIAGLVAALRASQAGASTVVLSEGGGASCWLQGVNVALGDADARDSPAVHFDDIVREGYGLSDRGLAHDTAAHAIEVLRELDALGVGFARDGERFRQRHASGSAYPRCCYVAGMMWGPKARRVLSDVLKARANVRFIRAHVVRVLVEAGRAVGVAAVLPRTGEPMVIGTGAVVLASGGAGGIFEHSTYPRDVTGTSYAMAYHAGARLMDMEFIQFEPLVAYAPKALRGFVIPTTLFGDGATLRDKDGKRFLLEVRPQGEAGIGKETLVLAMADMARRGRAEASGAVWLDARAVPRQVLEGYPWLFPYLAKRGVDLACELVALLPAAHTSLGGIAVDRRRESSVGGLFAVGEAAGGLHGAGRLAGGSGTDVIASGSRGGYAAAEVGRGQASGTRARSAFLAEFNSEAICRPPTRQQRIIHAEVRALMSQAAGIWRNDKDLNRALARVRELHEEMAPRKPLAAGNYAVILADILLVAGLVLESALARRESRGAHQRTDFPDTEPGSASSVIVPAAGTLAAYSRIRIPIEA